MGVSLLMRMVAITEAKGGDMAYFWNKGGGGWDCLKSRLIHLADLRYGRFDKKEGDGVFEGNVDTPMYIMSSQSNLKITTNCYENKCLLVIITKKIHQSKLYQYHTQGLCCCHFSRFVSGFFLDKVKNVWYTLFCLSLPCISRGQ